LSGTSGGTSKRQAKLGQPVAEARKKRAIEREIDTQKLSSINKRLLIICSRMVILLLRRLLGRISEDTNIVCHNVRMLLPILSRCFTPAD
jgi:hypothetical protein